MKDKLRGRPLIARTVAVAIVPQFGAKDRQCRDRAGGAVPILPYT